MSRRVASIWVVISLSVAVFIGIVDYGMSKAGALDILTGSNSETIIVKIAHLLSTHGVIAAIAAGVILAGILAATMSTPRFTASCRSFRNITESCKRMYGC